MPHAIALAGVALHAGVCSSVLLGPCKGPLRLEQNGCTAELQNLALGRLDQGVELHAPGTALRVDLVEHLLAAVGALGLTWGLRLAFRGPEPPLLDGGAARYCQALLSLGLAPQPPSLRITRPAVLELERSRYEFYPGADINLQVSVEFAHPLIGKQSARWEGDPQDFAQRIAPARTFGFLADKERLLASGRARGVSLSSVLVLTGDGRCLSEPGPEPEECARHKLLDLVGDLTVYGGPLQGRLHAYRPGHSITHRLMPLALAQGLVVRQ